MMIKPYYGHNGITLYCGDCRDILPQLDKVDLVLTDPPYPNNARHFIDGIETAEWFMKNYWCNKWFIFWDELLTPNIPLPLVAKHIWHRTNTNRPDNYEAIYVFNIDGKKRASRVLSYPVIYPGLTGCVEATGHPTQKNIKLMIELLSFDNADTILDPFCGSGTTLVAAKQLGRKAIGIEISQKYCDIAIKRLGQEYLL